MGQALEMCVRCENKRGCDLCADLHEWIMEHLEMENELKAYEDTGVEPCEYAAMREAMEKGERAKEHLLYMSHIIRNIGLDRVMELLKAEQEGRLVIIPYDRAVDDAEYDAIDAPEWAQRMMQKFVGRR